MYTVNTIVFKKQISLKLEHNCNGLALMSKTVDSHLAWKLFSDN